MQNNSLISPNAAVNSSHDTSYIFDVDHRNFMESVIEASQSQPILVDFWAPWCQPCKQFTPVLEKTVTEAKGAVKLAKLDVEANKSLASQLAQLGLPLQSIPLVVAFWQGRVHNLLQGAHPQSAVRAFIDTLLKETGVSLPTEALLNDADRALKEANPAEALSLYAQILETDANNPSAWAGVIRGMIALNDLEGAQEASQQVPPDIENDAAITQARSSLALYQESQEAAVQLDTLQQEAEKDPSNPEVAIKLAIARNGAGEHEAAAQLLLAIITQHPDEHGQAAKAELLRFFEAWGLTDPLTIKMRRQLSSLLFS
ncbi:tetratricopeptide repeat protein [Saccharibacter sp. 17.LH.SD]|uniref:tetratricopeptide repeat protein n=1 Tax=Saccharibacter sp. 17.LH.SD TaxID=2689393 RepID=UPI00136A57F0|nr:tetratricopeptide repeat protein [Saccharibacter sp. 17.LH.SD]